MATGALAIKGLLQGILGTIIFFALLDSIPNVLGKAVAETAIVVVVVIVLFPQRGCDCDRSVHFGTEFDPEFYDGHAGVDWGDQEVGWGLEGRVWTVDVPGVLVDFRGSGVGIRETNAGGGRGADADCIKLHAVPGLWRGDVSVSSAVGGRDR
ncbi:hypothetical protein BGZ46_005357 [Entomortierella lignicola]|nr:hypothetical protein BGZ46_005357 [Entomortierella lignicola]